MCVFVFESAVFSVTCVWRDFDRLLFVAVDGYLSISLNPL